MDVFNDGAFLICFFSEFFLPLYRAMIPRLARATEYAPKTFSFDNPRDCQVALEQGAAQDVYQLLEDVKEIRTHKMDSVWIRATQESPEKCSEYVVLVRTRFSDEDQDIFEDSWSRSVNGGSAQVGVAFEEPPAPGPEGEDRDRNYWPAIVFDAPQFKADLVLKVRRPTASDVGYQSRNKPGITSYTDFESFVAAGEKTQSVYLKFDDGVTVARRRVNAVHSAFSQDGTSLVPSVNPDDCAERKAEIAQLTNQARLMHLFKRDLFTGSGFFASLSPAQAAADVDGLAAGLGSLALSAPIPPSVPAALPRISILDPITHRTRTACLDLVDQAIRGSLVKYLESVRLGVFALIGCAGSGKTQLLAAITTMLWMNPDIGTVYGAAPTNVAVTNVATRCFDTMESLAKKLPSGHSRRYLPVVVRGHAMKSEVSAFLKHGGHPWVPAAEWDSIGQDSELDAYRPGPWQFRLSPAFWLWITLKMSSNIGHVPICPRLAEIKKCIREDPKYEGLCVWVDSKDSLDISTIHGGGTRAVEELVLDLLTRVVLAADVVLTTPHASGDSQYAAFNKTAKAVVLDEAGAMLQADALQVWGEGCRVCVLAGDEKQLQPTVMTIHKTDKKTGMATNSFAQLARVSVLEHLKRTGWPCFVLTRQHRIVNGGFDVAISTNYREIADKLTYSDRASLANVKHAAAVEQWLVARFKLQPAPQGKAFGAFLSHPGQCVVNRTTKSRGNLGQAKVAVNVI